MSQSRICRAKGVHTACGLLLFGLLCAGCSSDDHPPTLDTDQVIGDWCLALCSWRHGCGRDEPLASCSLSCRSGRAFESYGRPEFYREMATCLQSSADCSGGEDASWQTCYEEAALRVPLSQAAFDFCEQMGQLFFECGYGMSPTTCARNYIIFNDHMLDELQVCRRASCDTYTTCVDQIAFSS